MPPVAEVQLTKTHSAITCAARVAMARYSPLMRSEGTPTTAPARQAMTPPAGTASQTGTERREARKAAPKPPTPMKAAGPANVLGQFAPPANAYVIVEP